MAQKISMSESLTAADMLLTAKGITSVMGVDVKLFTGKGLEHRYRGVVDTASTRYVDGRYVIQIPCGGHFTGDVDMYLRGFLDHECGHVRFTDFDRASKFCTEYKEYSSIPYPLVTRLYNIFEDVRIERLMSEMYPGCGTNLRRLNVALFPKGELDKPPHVEAGREIEAGAVFAILGKAAVYFVLRHSLGLLYGENLYADALKTQCYELFGSPPKETYEYGLWSYVFTASARIADLAVQARTADDVEACVKAMCALLASLFTAIDRSVNEPQGCGGTAGLQDGTRTEQAARETRLMFDLSEAMREGEGSKYARMVQSMNNCNIKRARGRSCPNDTERELVAASRLANEMLQCGGGADAPRSFDHGSDLFVRHCHTRDRFCIEAIASRCRGMFQSLLETMSYHREKVGYFGQGLDTRRLWRSRVGDGRLFRTRAERLKLDTDVCILGDASGSMHSNIEPYMLVIHGIIRALRSLSHVRSAACMFNGNGTATLMAWDGEVPSTSVAMRVGGSTPMAGALLGVLGNFPKGKADARRIVFILTDGAPDYPDAMTMAVETARRRGFELYGIGLGNTHIDDFLGKENTCAVPNIDGFLPAFENMLMLALARRMAA